MLLHPFPYALRISIMLLFHVLITPVVCFVVLGKWYLSGLQTSVAVLGLWSLNYVATEIECPFGDDEYDLLMHPMLNSMIGTLLLLLDERAQTVIVSQSGDSTDDIDGGTIRDSHICSVRRSVMLNLPGRHNFAEPRYAVVVIMRATIYQRSSIV